MNDPNALALLINHESRTTFALDRDRPRAMASVNQTPSLIARIAERLGLRRVRAAGATA
jgi:hypothetical protein